MGNIYNSSKASLSDKSGAEWSGSGVKHAYQLVNNMGNWSLVFVGWRNNRPQADLMEIDTRCSLPVPHNLNSPSEPPWILRSSAPPFEGDSGGSNLTERQAVKNAVVVVVVAGRCGIPRGIQCPKQYGARLLDWRHERRERVHSLGS